MFIGPGLEFVTDSFEDAAGDEAVARGFELGTARKLADLDARDGDYLVRGVGMVAFDNELLDGPLIGGRGRGRGFFLWGLRSCECAGKQ